MAIPERRILEDELIAPCVPEGAANTLDEETREGCCDCEEFHCLIDGKNIVIQKTPRKIVEEKPELQPTL